MKKFSQNIDPSAILAYNRTMTKTTKTKGDWARIVLRIVLPILCACLTGFIFSNSLKTGEESIQQSSTIVKAVQDVVAIFNPESAIVTATGEAYDRLHNVVRTLAHFAEFALLGGLYGWCLFSYTLKKKYLPIPLCALAVVPALDECLQLFSAGRGMELTDILIDLGGGFCGFAFAAFTVWWGVKLCRRSVCRKEKGE